MKLRLATPSVLVDVGRIPDLSYVRDEGDHIAIGALDASPRPRDERPARARVRRAPGGRGRGRRQPGAPPRHPRRLGRRTATPRPTSPRCCSRSTRRSSPAGRPASGPSRPRDFFVGFLETALAPDELLTEIRVPKVTGGRLRVPEVQPAGAGLGDRRRARGRDNGSTRVALVNMGSTPLPRLGRRAGARGRRVRRRRRGARRRRHRAAERPQRHARVPRAPRTRAGAARAGVGTGLSPGRPTGR